MSIFSVERPESIQETMENMMRANAERQANLALLREQMTLEAEEAEKQEKLLAQDKAQQEQEKKNQAMEEAMQAKRVADSKKAVLEARLKLPSLARESIIRKTLFDITMESLWVDDKVKNTQEMRCEALKVFNETIEKCDKITGKPLMSAMENTKLLSCINDIATEEGNAIAERIITEADENDEISINFRMNADEINEVDRKMGELGTKELAKEIKKKVLKVVEDEKESGKVKAELFAELDDASKEEEEEPEATGEEGGDTSTETPEEGSGEEGTDEGTTESYATLEASANKKLLTAIYGSGKPSYKPKMSDYKLTFKNLPLLLQNLSKDCMNTGNFESIHGNLLKLVDSCKSVDDVNYLEKDLGWANLKVYADTVEKVEKGGDGVDDKTKNLIEKKIKKGLTSKKIRDHIEWLSSVYKPALKKKKKELSGKTKATTESLDELRLRLVRENANRKLNSMNGSSVFESIMMKSLNDIDAEHPTMEGVSLLESEKHNAALLQTVLEYTVLETLNTLKVYDFNLRNIGMIKKM